MSNIGPELQFKTLDVVILAVTGTWLQPGDEDNELMTRDHPFSRMDRGDRRIGSGELILVAEKYDPQEGHELNVTNVQALEIKVAIGGSRISVLVVFRSPGSMPAKGGKLFPLLSVVAGSAGKPFKLGDCGALMSTGFAKQPGRQLWASTPAVSAREWDGSTRCPSRWRFGQVSSVLDFVLTGTPNDTGTIELEEPVGRSNLL